MSNDLKVCRKCGETLPAEAFSRYWHKGVKRFMLRSWCSACMHTFWGQYRKENRAAIRRNAAKYQAKRRKTAKGLDYTLRYDYGLSLEQYRAMLAAQDGVCAICKRPPSGKRSRLSVDHDHATKRVRGLLCNECNTMLGYAKEDSARFRAALQYLAGHALGVPGAEVDLKVSP